MKKLNWAIKMFPDDYKRAYAYLHGAELIGPVNIGLHPVAFTATKIGAYEWAARLAAAVSVRREREGEPEVVPLFAVEPVDAGRWPWDFRTI